MDYGPFGFIEKFEPLWNMWTGGGEHYGFLNQPVAGHRNFTSFAGALLPLLDADGKKEVQAIVTEYTAVAMEMMNEMWCSKLGLAQWNEPAKHLMEELKELMEQSEADYTILFRLLAALVQARADGMEVLSDEDAAELFNQAFYKDLTAALKGKWMKWLNEWMSLVRAQRISSNETAAKIASSMRKASPKYVPREWMLVEAYTKANHGDYSTVHELAKLFCNPYDEQPEFEDKYFKKTPAATYASGGKGGTAFMT